MLHVNANASSSVASGTTLGVNGGAMGSNEGEIDLMRTILGESVPQSVILACLNACSFDVSAALNYYFMELASPTAEQASTTTAGGGFMTSREERGSGQRREAFVPLIQSGATLTLHPRNLPGIMSKTDGYYATVTRHMDFVTSNNIKFHSIRLRKRGWRPWNQFQAQSSLGAVGQMDDAVDSTGAFASQRPYFANGDIVSLECNGLWLKSSKMNKMLQWKSPSDDDRHKFVMRGLPNGRHLRAGDYFFLASYKWKDKEIVLKEDRPVSIGSYDTSTHGAFLGLDRLKRTTEGRVYFYATFTEDAVKSLPQPDDPFDANFLTVRLLSKPGGYNDTGPLKLSHPRNSLSDEISIFDAKIDQMLAITGPNVPRNELACFLDGAGGDVQIALEHYFMRLTQQEESVRMQQQLQEGSSASLAFAPSPMTSQQFRQPIGDEMSKMTTRGESSQVTPPVVTMTPPKSAVSAAVIAQEAIQRPRSQLLFPVPSMADQENYPEPRSPAIAHVAQPMSEGPKQRSVSVSNRSVNEVSDGHHEESLTIQDFEMLSVLGKGSFGAVMLVRFKQDGRIFAIKILRKKAMDDSDMMNAMEERQILQRIHHPYICGLVFAFQTNERLYLGMKYYAAGDLFYHLNVKGRIPLRDARLYAAELVLAISYLHELNILYRDLKPSNIMIDDEGHIGVVDFGLSKQHIYGTSYGVKTLSGTAEYVAPEALKQMADGTRNYGKAYDWWSLGIVLYEMLNGESPFYDENEHTMLHNIAFTPVVFPPNFPKEALHLVKGLLIKDPSRRLGAGVVGSGLGLDTIKADVFFTGIDWDKLARREVEAFWKPKLTGATDTRYVDPEFIEEGPPSAVYDPSALSKKSTSRRFSQFSFSYNPNN